MGTKKILIVEDEAIIAYDMTMRLNRRGYEVVSVASTAADAIEKASTLNPDLILTDVILDGKDDGLYAAEKIQMKRMIPVVFLTGDSHLIDASLMRSIRNYTIISKPPVDEEIFGAIEKLLGNPE
ncbi:MAG: response regulator [Spirochaetes bacterium]|jgi:1,2-diacylglycerol 3-beta-glucosyltransferase|nr:response regulator [Spirochaetota bacterium]